MAKKNAVPRKKRNPIPDYYKLEEHYGNLLTNAFEKRINAFVEKLKKKLHTKNAEITFGKLRYGSPNSSRCSWRITAKGRMPIGIEIKEGVVILKYGKREERCETFEKALDLIKLFWQL